jgi:hypothetical protein
MGRASIMESWAYKAVSIGAHTSWETNLGVKKPELTDEALQEQLDRWGAEGWECISLVPTEWRGGPNYYNVVTYRAMFKRRRV